jgi:hypothetical protein
MEQVTLIDAAIGLALFASVLGACHRGMGREMLHTVLFAIAVAAGFVIFRNVPENATAADVSFWVINSSYYLITAYALTWLAMKLISPLILGREQIGMRSRFWAGVLSIVKLGSVIFGLNLWFAVHSTEAHPLRLHALPAILRDSQLVRLSDSLTEDVYRWAAANNLLNYSKVVERAPESDSTPADPLDGLLSTSGTIPASH